MAVRRCDAAIAAAACMCALSWVQRSLLPCTRHDGVLHVCLHACISRCDGNGLVLRHGRRRQKPSGKRS